MDEESRRDAEARARARKNWKRRGNKEKVVYKTADEVAALPAVVPMEIRDYTQAGAAGTPKILSSVREASASFANMPGALPELQYNLRMLCDYVETDIQKCARRLEGSKKRLAKLKTQMSRVSQSTAIDGGRARRLAAMVGVLDAWTDRQTLADLSGLFAELRSKFYDEYLRYGVPFLAVSLATPLMEIEVRAWDVLANTGADAVVPLFQRWRTLLRTRGAVGRTPVGGGGAGRGGGVDKDAYDALVERVWLPRVRSGLTTWDVHQVEPCLSLMETWQPVVPEYIFEHVLFDILLPRLSAGVDAWNPRRDPVHLHFWFHPWLTLLGDALDPLHPRIRSALSTVLEAWVGEDPSAHAVVAPWRGVFDDGDFAQMIDRAIMPKLGDTLRRFRVNPANQDLAFLRAVLLWVPEVPADQFISLLEVEFFPGWYRALKAWVVAPDVDHEQVVQWYLGWKTVFPEELADHDRMKKLFSHALDIINTALVDASEVARLVPPQTAPSLRYIPDIRDRRRRHGKGGGDDGGMMAASSQLEKARAKERKRKRDAERRAKALTFKEQVQARLEAEGVVMLPGNVVDGRATHRVNRRWVVNIDNSGEIVRVYQDSVWQPVSVDDLLLLAQSQ